MFDIYEAAKKAGYPDVHTYLYANGYSYEFRMEFRKAEESKK